MENKILKIIKNEDGQVAFFIVFIIMSLLLFISLFLTNMTVKQTKITRNTFHSIQAYYLADMGTERVLWGLRSTAGDLDIINFPNAGDNIYSQNINNLTGAATSAGFYQAIRVDPIGTLNIKISGEYQETSRAIELSWN
ncbi:MAG: hypothetical protein KAS78_01755 [Candidatus Pacebacteria bacterium]|nr:hypothetical protein [Candidatus Paceibacterota bacterium]